MDGADYVEPGDETAESIIEAAAAAGCELSRDQLIRLHRHGLIARPHQVSRGPGGGRGTATVYPSGTADLAVRLCELRGSERRLDELSWLAWWNGLAVPDHLARDFLTAQMLELLKTVGELVTSEGELTDKAEDALDVSYDAQLEQVPMRWVRRRVGSKEFDWFLNRLLMIVAGRTDQLNNEDLMLLEHGMGLDRARTDQLASNGGPWLDSDPRADFEAIAERVAPEALEKALGSVSDEGLRQARDRAKAFASVVSNVGSVLRQTGDRWSYGFAAFGAIFDDMVSTPAKQAQFLLFILSCVRADGTIGIDQIIGQGPQADLTARQLEAIKGLREAIPEVAAAVPLSMLGKAISDTAAQERIKAAFAELRQAHGQQIDAFFAAHPEYRLSEGD